MKDRALLQDLYGVCFAIIAADGRMTDDETKGVPAIVAEVSGEPVSPADAAALLNDVYVDIGKAGDTRTYLAVIAKRHADDVAKKKLLVRAARQAMRLDGSVDPREEERVRDLAALLGVDA